MQNAAKNKSRSPAGPMALRVLLLLVVALCLGQTRVWGFAVTPQPASGVFESVTPSSNGENYDGCPYDASDSLLAAKTTPSGKLQPHPDASGSHTSFKVDPKTGKVTKYETYQPQPNPQNPSQWGFVKRVDTQYSPPHNHFNKATQTDVPTPHVHERTTAGGVRPALPDELPR